MRRSAWVTFLGVGGGTLLLMHSCGKDDTPMQVPEKVTVYADTRACMDDGNEKYACANAFRQALETHYNRAPSFISRLRCEAIYGSGGCDAYPMPNGGERAMPTMAGFAFGAAFGVLTAVPVHYDRDGNARVVGGDYRLGKRCRDDECGSSSGGGGGGGGGGGSSASSGGNKGKQVVSTQTGNLRSVSRGGFGMHFSGGG